MCTENCTGCGNNCTCFKCVVCDAKTDGSIKTKKGNYVCNECAAETMTTCETCGTLNGIYTFTEIDGKKYCEHCLEEEGYVKCSHCGEYHMNEITTDEYDYLCNDCYLELYDVCNDCGEEYLKSDMDVTSSGNRVCQACVNENYFRCGECGELSNYSDESERHSLICESCAEAMCNIRSYSYKPTPKFLGSPNGKNRYFGFELEINFESGKDKAEAVRLADENDTWYCKHDGSLAVEGVEFVSHPMTYNYLRKDSVTKELLEHIEDVDHNTYGCGLHIHTNKKGLSRLHQYKIGLLGNIAFNYLIALSDRGEYGSSHYYERSSNSHSFKNKYQAINLKNEHTIEFRFFVAKADTEWLKRSAKIVQGIIDYAGKTQVYELSESGLKKYIKETYGILSPAFSRTPKNRDIKRHLKNNYPILRCV